MKAILLLLAVVLASPSVHAGVVISQVLYDPGAESGGEAVELRNDGTTAADISFWLLSTEASLTDATVPNGTLLPAGGTYLVADEGWSSAKDNAAWRNADTEQTLTMANANSGVALKDSTGRIIDAVGWGDAAEIKQGLFEGAPAAQVAAGKALVRQKDTGNNAADFAEGEPSFFSGETVVIVVNITNATLPQAALPLFAAIAEDDAQEAGIQLRPSAGTTRMLHVIAHYNGTGVKARLFNASVALTNSNGVWSGELPLDYWRTPGEQQVRIITETQNATLAVTVLELKAAHLVTKSVAFNASLGGSGKGTILVKNTGNIPADVSWQGGDLQFGSQKIAADRLRIAEATVKPAETKAVEVALDVPFTAVPGTYQTRLIMQAKY
jgi:hypothetical protein